MSDTATSVNATSRSDYATQFALYRQGLREYLSGVEWASDWRAAASGATEDLLDNDAAILSRLSEAGWNRYGWPGWAGGLGGNEIHRAIFYDELGQAMLHIPVQQRNLETLAPALVKFAPHLAARFLPRSLGGDEWWEQCFAEPSGSDLASVQCRATMDENGGMTINGHKTVSIQGASATRLLVLVRTSSTESRHRGLSTVFVDADTPGITVRPTTLAGGRRGLADVIFDDVRVFRERLVGEVNDGWAVASFLRYDVRGLYGYAALTNLLTRLGGLRTQMVAAGASSSQRQRFARVYVDVGSAQARAAASVRQIADGLAVGAASDVGQLLFGRAEHDVNDLILSVRRSWLVAGLGEGDTVHLDADRSAWWRSRAASITGENEEIDPGAFADPRVAEEWPPMRRPEDCVPLDIQESVHRLFGEVAATPVDFLPVGPLLAGLGWADVEKEYPVAACELLFRAQGRALAQTDCLDRVMLAELAALFDEPVDGIVLPDLKNGYRPGSNSDFITGVVVGPLSGPVTPAHSHSSSHRRRLVVAVSGAMDTVSIGMVNAADLDGERLDTLDPSVHWTRVEGPLRGSLIPASIEWSRAIAAAHRAQATELLAIAGEILQLTVSCAGAREQFGSPIGALQAPNHALAEAAVRLEGARALLGESWRFGGRFSALAAKEAAGRAHMFLCDVALQVCGADGLTADNHLLNRYVTRGLQVDLLCGSHEQLQVSLAAWLLDVFAPGRAIPATVAWG